MSPLSGADELSAGEEALVDNLGTGQFQGITPTGAINDANVTFTLPGTPVSGSLILTKNGQVQLSGTGLDFTLSGVTITFTTAPLSGEYLRAWFMSTST